MKLREMMAIYDQTVLVPREVIEQAIEALKLAKQLEWSAHLRPDSPQEGCRVCAACDEALVALREVAK